MIEIAVAIGPLALLLVASEVLWRAKLIRGESARKMLHIIIGSYVASWLYFLTFRQIQLLSLAMLAGVIVSHKYHIFHAINDVKRKTWGDILYAVGLGLTALFAEQPWIFALAILHMSVADGLAGLVGTSFGKSSSYKVFGHTKSAAGTVTFVVASFVLLLAFSQNHPSEITTMVLVFVPFVLAAAENIGVLGTDNILIPVLTVLLFR